MGHTETLNKMPVDWTTPSLTELMEGIWARLRQAAESRSDAWHVAALATVAAGQPAVRAVVLRRADAANRALMFFSDARAEKIRQLQERPRVEWMFYDPAQRVQLRAQGTVVVHQDNTVTEAIWNSKPDLNYLHYLSPLPPGTGLPAFLPVQNSFEPEQETAYRNFAVVVTVIERFDWLRLEEDSHRRARFEWNGDHFEGRWTVA